MNIRDEIRDVLNEIFNEASPSPHFKDRVFGRLTSSLYTNPQFNYNDVKNQIEIIKKVNFNPKQSFAISIRSFPTTFVSRDPETGKESIGNEIWTVIRNNEIATIFFRNTSQRGIKVSGVDYTVNFKSLQNIYNSSEKNPDGTVDFEMSNQKPGKGQRKKVELDLPIVELEGNSWYIDEEKEELIYAKNIKKKLSFDDLQEEYLEKVINAVTTKNMV